MGVTALKTAAVEQRNTEWTAVARELGKTFATRAATMDEENRFVAENYALCRDASSAL